MTHLTLADDARRLLDWLHRGGNYAHLWGVKDKKKTSRWYQVGQPAEPFNTQHNNYFGVHPCSTIPPTNAQGKPAPPVAVRSQVDYIAAINCLFAEFDAKHFAGDKPAALAHIEALDPTPSVVVDSGGGYHCYWLLTDPFILASADDRARADHAQKGWVKRVGSDDGAKDLARVLRVPGTYNFKPEYAPDYPLVRFMRADFDRLYTFDELEALLPPELPAPVREPHPVVTAAPGADYLRRWCVAALEGERTKMLAAGDGERHQRRYDSAHALGGLVHASALTEQEIFDALAVNFGPNQKNAETTIWDGIRDGKEHPRTIPEPEQATFDRDGYACCPTHRQRLVACFNGNGYRCPAPKYGEPLCFWWHGEGYTPPAEVCADDLDALDADELRRRLRAAITERDRWRERAEQLQAENEQLRARNRFDTQAHGAEGIGPAGKRLTFIELKKELDRVPREERDPDQWSPIRPSYMAACSRQNKGTISTHLKEFEEAGLIEKKVEKLYNPDTDTWCSTTFVRPLVDLSDPSQVIIPSKPRGKQACRKCGSTGIVRQVRVSCPDCGHAEWSEPEAVNPPEPELQSATQPDAPSDDGLSLEIQHIEDNQLSSLSESQTATQDAPPTGDDSSELQIATQADDPPQDAATFFEQQPEPGTATAPEPSLSLEMRDIEDDQLFSLSELQTATQAPPPVDALPNTTDNPYSQHTIIGSASGPAPPAIRDPQVPPDGMTGVISCLKQQQEVVRGGVT